MEAAPGDGGRAQVRRGCLALPPRRCCAAQPLAVAALHRELATTLAGHQRGGVDRPLGAACVCGAGLAELQ